MKEIINIIPSKDISFRTRSLLSQILGRLELTRQDRIDLEKYITFCGSGSGSGEENLDDIKENLEIFIEYKDKILNIIKDAPEEFDTLIEIFDYIETHITESNKTLGEINNKIKVFPKKEEFATINGMSLFDKKDIEIKGSGADATTTAPIPIKGGPLANDIEDTDYWPESWYEDPNDSTSVKVIPANKTFQEVLENLFLKLINGTVDFDPVTWSPGINPPTVAIDTNERTLEVGSVIKVTNVVNGAINEAKRAVKLKASQGYFIGDNLTHIPNKEEWFYSDKSSQTNDAATISYKWRNNSVSVTLNSTELKVGEKTNTLEVTQSGNKATVSKIPNITVYASTNTNKKLPNVTKTFKETADSFTSDSLKNSTKINIIGSYYYFIGTVNGTGLTFDDSIIRSLTKQVAFVNTLADNGTEVLSELSVLGGGKTTIIAVPKGYTLKDIKQSGDSSKGAWTLNGDGVNPKTTTKLILPDGTEHEYNIFYAENKAASDSKFSNVKLGKI